MRASDLKYTVLAWLYEQYRTNPEKASDIVPLLEQHGISTESGIDDFCFALKSSGLVREYSDYRTGSFNAIISVKGIELISGDIRKEVAQLLEDIKDDSRHFYPILKHLKHLPGHYRCALDVANYLRTNAFAEVKIDDEDIYIRITEAGIAWVSPVGSNLLRKLA